MTQMEDMPLAVFTRRPAEERLTVEIEGGLPAVPEMEGHAGHAAAPPLVVRFRVPGPEDAALIEARTRQATLNLLQGRGAEARYGLKPMGELDEAALAALGGFISAVESGAHLIEAWNLAIVGADGKPERVPVTAEAVAELFRGRPAARAGWTLQYDNASPLDRAEGNGFAASPATTSATAANTAGDAPSGRPDAVEAASDQPGSSAPAP